MDAAQIADVMRRLDRCWQIADDDPAAPGSLRRIVPIGEHDASLGDVSIGLPWLSHGCSQRWIGNRVVLWPRGVPSRRRLGVCSSRLAGPWASNRWWFELLRHSVLCCDPGTEILSAVEGTASSRAVVRAARLFGKPLLLWVVANDGLISFSALQAWLESCASTETDADDVIQQVFVSPEISDWRSDAITRAQAVAGSQPLADRLAFAASDRVQVLSCRRGGHVHALIEEHCHDEDRQGVPILVASDETGHMPTIATGSEIGVVRWIVQPWERDATGSQVDLSSVDARPAVSDVAASSPLTDPDAWLLHWTRAPRGVWPGESEEELLDACILGCAPEDRTAAGSLLRILREGVLRASSEGIRGGFAVVSLTAVPLAEFRQRRIWRRHRHRFDFEPWGIAIRRDVLQQSGVRPVSYGADAEWNALSDTERPYFQKATADDVTNTIAEQEWRSVGDVDFGALPNDSVCVFVDTESARCTFAAATNRPIVVVP